VRRIIIGRYLRESDAVGLKADTQYPYVRAVRAGRTYGCIFRHPYVRAVVTYTARTYGPYLREVRIGLKTGVIK